MEKGMMETWENNESEEKWKIQENQRRKILREKRKWKKSIKFTIEGKNEGNERKLRKFSTPSARFDSNSTQILLEIIFYGKSNIN